MNRTKKETIETVYCVKYALTQGIFTVEGYERDNGRFMCSDRLYQSFREKEWTRCPEEALKIAETLREKKMASLLKHMARVRSVKFEIPHEVTNG